MRYLQEKIFSESDIELSRQPMSLRLITCADKLQPLMRILRTELIKQKVLCEHEPNVYYWKFIKAIAMCGVTVVVWKIQRIKLAQFEYQQDSSSQHAAAHRFKLFVRLKSTSCGEFS